MINIAEILKNAPQGLKLYSLVHGEVTLESVDTAQEYYPIDIIDNKSDSLETFTKDGKLYHDFEDAECILFPSKEHKSWNNWQEILFQIGDIIKYKSSKHKEEVNIQTDIYVYDGYDKSSNEYIGYNIINKNEDDLTYLTINEYEYATPEERDQFFKELNANGYKWNADTKQIEKSLQTNSCGCVNAKTKERSFTIDSFKTFDKVLCRCKGEYWGIEFFERYDDGKYYCLSCRADYCIPYNDETKHLIGTDDDCPDKYKTW